MRRFAFLVLMLAAAAGCASSASSRPVSPVAQAAEVEVGSDPSWCPPSEMEMNIAETTRTAPKTETVNTLHIPKQEKPRGVVHAATY